MRIYNIPYQPVTYESINFRSTLECRWYIFLNTLKVISSYEPKKFYFPEHYNSDAYVYSPDFGLLNCPYDFLEIKPTLPVPTEIKKCVALSNRGYKVAMFAGPCSPKVKVLRWQNGTRLRFRKGVKFYAQCFIAGITPEMGETIAGLKAVLGERQNWTEAFEMAYRYKV